MLQLLLFLLFEGAFFSNFFKTIIGTLENHKDEIAFYIKSNIFCCLQIPGILWPPS
jgi:hypothetical protein